MLLIKYICPNKWFRVLWNKCNCPDGLRRSESSWNCPHNSFQMPRNKSIARWMSWPCSYFLCYDRLPIDLILPVIWHNEAPFKWSGTEGNSRCGCRGNTININCMVLLCTDHINCSSTSSCRLSNNRALLNSIVMTVPIGISLPEPIIRTNPINGRSFKGSCPDKSNSCKSPEIKRWISSN